MTDHTPIREYGLYKASDLLLGNHVCEKSDAVKWIDFHDYHLYIYMITSC